MVMAAHNKFSEIPRADRKRKEERPKMLANRGAFWGCLSSMSCLQPFNYNTNALLSRPLPSDVWGHVGKAINYSTICKREKLNRAEVPPCACGSEGKLLRCGTGVNWIPSWAWACRSTKGQ
eukprot:scaffold110541_cov18-Tisochrysis_lutea.AAC.1